MDQSATVLDPIHYSKTRPIDVPSSPTPELFHTYDVPSLTQADHIQRSILQVESNVAELDSDIDRMKGQHDSVALDELLHKRRALEAFIEDHRCLFSVIRRVPPEIWSMIFLHCLPTHAREDIDIDLRRSTLSLITHVCCRWRHIAISTPQLWSTVVVTSFTDLDDHMVETYLKRAVGFPLDIAIRYLTYKASRLPYLGVTPILKTFASHSRHWRSSSFMYVPDMMMTLDIVKHRLPLLEHLALDFSVTAYVLDKPFDTFEFAPLLRSIHILEGTQASSLRLPWNQLTEIRVYSSYFDIRNCRFILEQAPNLVTCQLTPTTLGSWGDHRTFCLQHMLTLQITELRRMFTPFIIFDYLSLPALTHLSYISMLSDSTLWQPIFKSFLWRTSYSLQTLSLHLPFVTLRDNELIECLTLTPNLKELRFGEPSSMALTNWFLTQLTCSEEDKVHDGCVVPNLETFKFLYFSSFDDDAFVDMMTSRWKSQHYCLAHVRVFARGAWNSRLDERLRELEEQGITMDVTLEPLCDPEAFITILDYL